MCISDTDGDGLSDGDEVRTYGTNPLQEDTDSDGVDDATELTVGTNPLVFNSSFDCRYEYSNEERVVKPAINIEGLNAEQVNQVSISSVTTGQLADPQIPRYIDTAFNFSEIGDFDTAVVSFEIPAEFFEDEDFEPAIYWYDEENELLTKVENQDVNGHIISVTVTHFSKYMVLNAKKHDKVWETELLYDENGEESFKAIDVVFVLDTSGSMDRNDPYYERRTVTQNFINQLTENDLAAVIGFDDSASVYSGFTSNHEALYQAIDQIDNNGGTNLSAAVSSALSLFTSSGYEGTERLKFIVMLTDGKGDYSSTYTTQAANLNVIIYTVGLGSEIDTSLLTAIAEGTGGAYYHASRADDLNAIFEKIAEESDLYKDTDFDGLIDYYEKETANGNLVLGTGVPLTGINYRIADSDNDGLMDGQEITARKVKNRVFLTMTSNPTMADSDQDGISDSEDKNPFIPDVKEVLVYQSKNIRGLGVVGTPYEGKPAKDLKFSDESLYDLSRHGKALFDTTKKPKNVILDTFYLLFSIGTFSASKQMKSVKDDMINHFISGNASDYSNPNFTQQVFLYGSDPKPGLAFAVPVSRTMSAMTKIIERELIAHDGDVTAMRFNENSDKNSDDVTAHIRYGKDGIYKGVPFPKFSALDSTNGFSILIHGFHGYNATIKYYKLNGNEFSGILHFHFYDHFGLDDDDEITYFGFSDWYTLQHYDRFNRRYTPFIVDFEYDIPFSGTIRDHSHGGGGHSF